MSKDPDDLYGDTVVAFIEIKLRRNGAMSVGGSITDEVYAKHLLDTAKETLSNYHIQKRGGVDRPIIVPAYDTSLVGTPEEKKLIAAHGDLVKAHDAR